MSMIWDWWFEVIFALKIAYIYIYIYTYILQLDKLFICLAKTSRFIAVIISLIAKMAN
jgi:hypothetical protein